MSVRERGEPLRYLIPILTNLQHQKNAKQSVGNVVTQSLAVHRLSIPLIIQIIRTSLVIEHWSVNIADKSQLVTRSERAEERRGTIYVNYHRNRETGSIQRPVGKI